MKKSPLRERIFDSLIICQDGGKKYLRFAPVETERFRFGLSLNVNWDKESPEDEEFAKNMVADYLADAVELLTALRPKVKKPVAKKKRNTR